MPEQPYLFWVTGGERPLFLGWQCSALQLLQSHGTACCPCRLGAGAVLVAVPLLAFFLASAKRMRSPAMRSFSAGDNASKALFIASWSGTVVETPGWTSAKPRPSDFAPPRDNSWITRLVTSVRGPVPRRAAFRAPTIEGQLLGASYGRGNQVSEIRAS